MKTLSVPRVGALQSFSGEQTFMLELPRRHLVGVVVVMFMLLLQLLMVVVANIGFDIKL
jgi:hypothetical protein